MAFTITPQAPYAWQKGDKHACHQALGIWPFQWSPFDVDSDEPPAWVMKREADAPMGATSWARAWGLRQALCELAGEHGRMIDMDGRWRRSAARGQALSDGRHSTGGFPRGASISPCRAGRNGCCWRARFRRTTAAGTMINVWGDCSSTSQCRACLIRCPRKAES